MSSVSVFGNPNKFLAAIIIMVVIAIGIAHSDAPTPVEFLIDKGTPAGNSLISGVLNPNVSGNPFK